MKKKSVTSPEFYKLVKDNSTTETVKLQDNFDIFENKYKRQSKLIYKNIINVINSNISNSKKIDKVNKLLQNFNTHFNKSFSNNTKIGENKKVEKVSKLLQNFNSSDKNTHKEIITPKIGSEKIVFKNPLVKSIYGKVRPSFHKDAKILLNYVTQNHPNFKYDPDTYKIEELGFPVDKLLAHLVNKKPGYLDQKSKSLIHDFVEYHKIPHDLIRNKEYTKQWSYPKKQKGFGYNYESKKYTNKSKVKKPSSTSKKIYKSKTKDSKTKEKKCFFKKIPNSKLKKKSKN